MNEFMNSIYKVLHNEYLSLCESSEIFRKDTDISVDGIINSYYSHPNSSVGLDIARDYMFFGDKYEVIINEPERLERIYQSTIAPKQDIFEIKYGSYNKDYNKEITQEDIDSVLDNLQGLA